MLTKEQTIAFERDGYVIVPGFLSPEETQMLGEIARQDEAMLSRISTRKDAISLSLTNDLGDNIYSAIAQSERLVRPMEALLGGEVYHYHYKISAKRPLEGGGWEWHQDYGYWYNNGCLFPYMASCYIAIDPATKRNRMYAAYCWLPPNGSCEPR